MTSISRQLFDRVILINLDRRKDRLQQVMKNLSECNWPFREPERFRAVDASKLDIPPYWFAGGGAFGCMRSHQRALEDAIMDGVDSLLVLEDDVVFRPDFGTEVVKFMQNVPTDWDQLMIGGQLFHDSLREQVAPGVLRVNNCQRTHCYAVRGKYMKALHAKWCASYGHCDHVMGPFQRRYSVYAPDPFLAGQSEGKSDINGAHNPAKFWVAPIKNAPIFWVRCPKSMVRDLWQAGLHSGRNKTDKGIDAGLAKIVDAEDGFFAKQEKLNNWVSMIEWEGRSMTPEAFTCIWHPDLDGDMFEEIFGDRLVQIESDDLNVIRERVRESVNAVLAKLASE